MDASIGLFEFMEEKSFCYYKGEFGLFSNGSQAGNVSGIDMDYQVW
jgi:hypothetical protein